MVEDLIDRKRTIPRISFVLEPHTTLVRTRDIWEKDPQENRERMSEFCKKKSEEQALKDSSARQQALKQLGITQEFNNSGHAEIYNYAARAPIESVDANVHPPESTQYPEPSPCSSQCPVPGERINHALPP